jgi:hypothetical protein
MRGSHFWMWRKMFAIGRPRNKLVSPASFNYQSIFSSQFLLLLPLLLPLVLPLLLRLLQYLRELEV